MVVYTGIMVQSLNGWKNINLTASVLTESLLCYIIVTVWVKPSVTMEIISTVIRMIMRFVT